MTSENKLKEPRKNLEVQKTSENSTLTKPNNGLGQKIKSKAFFQSNSELTLNLLIKCNFLLLINSNENYKLKINLYKMSVDFLSLLFLLLLFFYHFIDGLLNSSFFVKSFFK